MTDELKPDLKKALEKLPRERMPEGLEARLTDALREGGILAKRRRVVAVTNARVAGLLAACVALVIGAYSIGLHRGDQPFPGVLPQKPVGRLGVEESDVAAPEEMEQTTAAGGTVETPTKEVRTDRTNEAKKLLKNEPTEREEPAPPVDEFEEAPARRDRPTRGLADAAGNMPPPVEEKPAASEAIEKPMVPSPRSSLSRSAAKSAPMTDVTAPPMTFLLGGLHLAVDAPDSVRVVADDHGRMLLIFTSDGVIRVRVTEDN